MFGRDLDRMMQMWAELLGEIENSPMQHNIWERVPDRMKRPKIGTVEDRDEDIALTADLPGVEKKDIELSVDHNSIAFKAKTEERDYDFGQSFDFELNPEEVKATFVNGVLDVVVKKAEGTKSKPIQIE
jgi:HSP20 family molecular chaperone IbpA